MVGLEHVDYSHKYRMDLALGDTGWKPMPLFDLLTGFAGDDDVAEGATATEIG